MWFSSACASLDRHATRHFTHRGQQRQAAVISGHCFVGDGNTTGLLQQTRLLRVGRQVQVSKQYLPLAEHRALLGLGLLDLDHHLGTRKNFSRASDNFSARHAVHFVGQSDAIAGVALYDHLVSAVNQLLHRRGGQSHTKLQGLDFFRYAYEH